MFDEPQIGLPGSHNPLHRILQESGISHQAVPLIVAGVATAIGAIAGGVAGAQKDARANREQEMAHDHAVENWDYEWDVAKEQYEHQEDIVDANRHNNQQQVNYQNAALQQEWNHSMAIADYEFNQQNAAYNASVDTYGDQLEYNAQALTLAQAHEDIRLQETVTQSAYDSQQLLQNMYETAGLSTFETAQNTLNLQNVENEAGYAEAVQLQEHAQQSQHYQDSADQLQTELEGKTALTEHQIETIGIQSQMNQSDALYQQEQSRNDFEEALNETTQTTSSILHQLDVHQQETSIARNGLSIDVFESEVDREFAQKEAAINLNKMRVQNANEAHNLSLQALEKKGQARLGQAGLSNAVTVQAVVASMGRQAAALADAVSMEGGYEKLLNWKAEQKAAIAEAKAEQSNAELDLSFWDKTLQANIDITAANAGLDLSQTASELTISQLDNRITDIADLADSQIQTRATELETAENITEDQLQELANNQSNLDAMSTIELTNIQDILEQNRAENELSQEQVDWQLVQDQTQFATNQDIIKSMLDIAVQESANTQQQLTAESHHADLVAAGNLLTRPIKGPAPPEPDQIPFTEFVDPLDPDEVGKPPKPIPGVKHTGGWLSGAPGGASQGANIGSSVVGAGSAADLW